MTKRDLIELIELMDDDTEIVFEIPSTNKKSKMMQFVSIDGIQEVEDAEGNIYFSLFSDYNNSLTNVNNN